MAISLMPTPQDGDRIPVSQQRELVRENGVWKQRAGDSVFNSAFFPIPALPVNTDGPWVRPADWLPMPPVFPSNEQKISILTAVREEPTMAGFQCWGLYTVDWGDGTVEDFNAGEQAFHQYDYATYDVAGDTLCSRGYKQAIIQITTREGSDLTEARLFLADWTSGYLYTYSSDFLDLHVNAEKLALLRIANNETLQSTPSAVRHMYLEHISITRSDLRNASRLFMYCYGLRKVSDLVLSTKPAATVEAVFNPNTWTIDFAEPHGLRPSDPFILTDVTDPVTGPVGTVALLYVATVTEYSITWASVNGTGSGIFPYATGVTFTVTTGVSLTNAFYNCGCLTDLPEIAATNIISMNEMFSGCTQLKEIPLFDTGKVRTISGAFTNAYALITVPAFDFTAVNDAYNAFFNAGVVRVPDLDLRNCYNASYLLGNARLLTHAPKLRLDKAIQANQLFVNCGVLQYVPDLTLPEATTTASMFSGCRALKLAPKITAPKVTIATQMFSACTSLVSAPDYNFPMLQTAASMFNSCAKLTAGPALNAPVLANITGMYTGCTAVETIADFHPLASITGMSNFATSCFSLKQFPAINTENVLSASSAFNGCRKVTGVPGYNFAKATDLTSVYLSCFALEGTGNTVFPEATTVQGMFSNCTNLKKATGIHIPKAIYAGSVFSGCTLLDEVSFTNTAALTTVTDAFLSCYALRKITGLDLSSATSTVTISDTAQNLSELQLSGTINTNLTIRCTRLNKADLEAILTMLPAATPGTRTINISDNFGTATVNTSIATAKGWTVVY